MKQFSALFIISLLIISSCGGGSDEVNNGVVFQQQNCESSDLLTNTDPLAGCTWHLINTGQEAFAKSGGSASLNSEFIDVNMKNTGNIYKGEGIRIAVSDTGLQLIHEDLISNIFKGQSKNYQSSPPFLGDPGLEGENGDHGTSVAGIIAARDGNNKGSRGIASRASIAGLNFLSSTQNLNLALDQLQGPFDIFNQSWGLTPEAGDGNGSIDSSYVDQLKFGVKNLRSGLGAVYVKSAGNSFTSGVNSNMDPYNVNPFTLVIAAYNANGISASYSQAGSNNFISAPGGEFGSSNPAIVTTDIAGCENGYARSQDNPTNTFEKAGPFNPLCSYTSTFNGTSSAAPIVSGAVALIMEVNPNLSWRDIRHILITTAKKIHASASNIMQNLAPGLPAIPPGHVWEQGWETNTAGYNFHNWYGFGAIDIDSAITAAQSYTTDLQVFNESVKSNGAWAYDTGTVAIAVPDNDATGASQILNVTQNYTVESVQIKVDITHPHVGDIGLELTSPSGTKSILLNVNNYFRNSDNLDSMILLSHKFYGEPTQGNWTLKVIDGANVDTGTLTRFQLKINGRAATTLSF